MDEVRPYLPYLLEGLPHTIAITVGGLALALIVGTAVGLARVSGSGLARWAAIGFIEFFRGTSEIVQMYWLFFALPLLLAIRVPPLTAGLIVLGLNQGAYVAEIVRGSIQGISRQQIEAAVALNMTRGVRMRRVIFPQAVASMLPSLGNVSVDLLKATSVVSLITVADITFRAQQIRSAVGESLVVFTLLIVLYLGLSSILLGLFWWLERRLPLGLRNYAGRR